MAAPRRSLSRPKRPGGRRPHSGAARHSGARDRASRRGGFVGPPRPVIGSPRMTTPRSSQSMAQIALFAALVAVLGLVPRIDLPFGVPITAQTLGVMLAGCLLRPAPALLSLLLFLMGVALGLPLLSGGRGGLGVFAAPSAGFLLGFPLGAAATALAMR